MNDRRSTDAGLTRELSMELARVTEAAAVAAARLRGRGDEKAADQVAVDAMRKELNALPIDGTVVIGEGERDVRVWPEYNEKNGGASASAGDDAADADEAADDAAEEDAEEATIE